MICSSCGGNSDNKVKCDYCGSQIASINTSEILVEKDSRKAQILELNEQLSYIYADRDNIGQVVSRLIDSSKDFIDGDELKKAEFLLQLAASHDDNEEAVLLSAKVKVRFALNLSGSIQMANIKKKYILDAKQLLEKVKSDLFAQQKQELELLISKVSGKEASHFTVQGNISADISPEELQRIEKISTSGKNVAGVATIIGWILGTLLAGLIGLGMLVPYLE